MQKAICLLLFVVGIVCHAQILATGSDPRQYTVATLPSAASRLKTILWVNDSTSTTLGVPVTGGGTAYVPVQSDGTNWNIVSAGAVAAGFNPTLSAFRTLLTNSATTAVNIGIYGDSLSRCHLSGGANCNVGPSRYADLWNIAMQGYLQNAYGNNGTGVMPIIGGAGTVDARWWTVAGTTAISTVIGPSEAAAPVGGAGAGGGVLQMANAATATLTPENGDTVTIYYATGTDTGSGFTVTVDGTSKGTFGNATSGSYTAAKLSIALGVTSNAPHKVLITSLGTNCYIYGAQMSFGSAGVSVHNQAISAVRTDMFSTNADLAFSDLIAPQVAFIELGTNDVTGGNTSTTVTNNLTFLINHLLAHGTQNVILLAPTPNSTTPGGSLTIATLASAEKSLAASLGIQFLDLSTLPNFDTVAHMQSAGYITSDNIHLTDAGNLAIAKAVVNFITGTTPNLLPGQFGTLVTTNQGGGWQQIGDTGEALQVQGLARITATTSNKALLLVGNNTYGGSTDVGMRFLTATGIGDWAITSWETVCGDGCGEIGFYNTLTGRSAMTFDKQGNFYNFASTTVSGLSTCAAGTKGAMRIVTDATSPTYLGALTGGGTVMVLAICDGTSWKSH